MYLMTPRTILFREEHSRRVLVPKVDMVSAAGISAPGVFRRGTAEFLVTGRCVFLFDPDGARFRLETIHPGEDAASIRAHTGFDYYEAAAGVTPDPSPDELALLRGQVRAEMEETYPEFCTRVWGGASRD